MAHAGFTTAKSAIDFIMGGNAIFTITSRKTGTHFTYKVKAKKDADMSFASVLNGPDNWENYKYIGLINHGRGRLIPGRKGNPYAPSFGALAWTLNFLIHGELPNDVKIQHEDRCCMCNRRLTDPTSVELGIGPECRSKQ